MIQSIGILQAATPFPAISLPAIFAQIAHILRSSCSLVLLAGKFLFTRLDTLAQFFDIAS